MYNSGEIQGFYPKIATSGLHLNLMQKHDYSSNNTLYQL